jgi:hypothetical protein
MVALGSNLDVIYVIACHLARLHAYGTLASLRLANYDVAELVLPLHILLVVQKDGLVEKRQDELRNVVIRETKRCESVAELVLPFLYETVFLDNE